MGWDDGKNPFNDPAWKPWTHPDGTYHPPHYGDPVPPKKKPIQLPSFPAPNEWPWEQNPQIIDNEELLEQYEKQKAKEKAAQEMAQKLKQLQELLAKKKAKEAAEEKAAKAKKAKAKKKRKPRKKKAEPIQDPRDYDRQV